MNPITIVGGGWAGLAAAVRATQQGWQVRLLEAAPQLGGRARRIQHQGLALDNGQHILIGAYRDTLQLMRTVGLRPEELLLRLPMNLQSAQGRGLRLPDLPKPLNLLWGVATATAWSAADKWGLMQRSLAWQLAGFRCDAQTSVATLCRGLSPRVMADLIEPLCVSALNTACDQASGQVFLRVLKDALFSGQGSSDMLLPRVDLGRLWPDAALAWLEKQGAEVVLGQRVSSLEPHMKTPVLLACPAWEAAALTQGLAPDWAAQAAALPHTAITTVYVRTSTPRDWPSPLCALASHPDAPAQFAFDKERISGLPEMHGVLALVVSASGGDRDPLTQAVLRQAATQLGLHDLEVLTTVVEKRATFACTPGLKRPPLQVAKGVWACGDYIDGPYPATLEGAVQSGFAAVAALSGQRMGENTA